MVGFWNVLTSKTSKQYFFGKTGDNTLVCFGISKLSSLLHYKLILFVIDLKETTKQYTLSFAQTKEMNDHFRSTAKKVKLAMETNPGANEHPLRKQRSRVHQDYLRYMQGKEKIDMELRSVHGIIKLWIKSPHTMCTDNPCPSS